MYPAHKHIKYIQVNQITTVLIYNILLFNNMLNFEYKIIIYIMFLI